MSIPTFNSFLISSLTLQSLVFRFVCVDHSHIFYCCGNFCFLNISFLMPLEILLAFSSSFLFYLEWKKFNNSLALWMLTIFIFRFVRIISSKSIMKFSYWGLWIFGKHQKKKIQTFSKRIFNCNQLNFVPIKKNLNCCCTWRSRESSALHLFSYSWDDDE